ncbi:MAG: sodium:solute symporter family protein [Acetobacteraceae bacterium]
MATAIFVFLIALSIVIALAAKLGHNVTDIKGYLIASRQFGSALLFFLAVGEIYSIGTMIGFPGGIYAKGPTYGLWFLGYILLAYPIGYFLNPLIWRAGKLYDAVTLPDLFKGHFGNRPLELGVTVAAVVFLIPWGQLQFTGMIVALRGLGWHFNSTILVLIAAVLAFSYIVISGIRAPAFVSMLKDTIMIAAIVIVGVAAARMVGVSTIFQEASKHIPARMTGPEQTFAMSTILFQALGFYMFPFSTQFLFTARSENTIRRTQIVMPLYMLMYPFLVVAAYFTLAQSTHLAAANNSFMVAAVRLLPDWLLGVVAAGAALSGLLVLASISLAIGPLVTRNLFYGVPEARQKLATQIVIVLYLLISILLTLAAPGTLMLTIINTAYFGIGQFFPGVIAILFFRKVNPWAVLVGLAVADVLAIALYSFHVGFSGLNIGLVCLVVNVVIVVLGSAASRHRSGYIPVAHRQPSVAA